ncbi:MAG: Ig-like domain-containing protein, partial [Thermoplasmata archaeon]|nr:Ig-like domain-containing protein [Thermoplasmata archaeon]
TSHDENKLIPEANWTSINCIICNDQHTLELGLYNGTAREEPPANISALCGACHSGHHPQYEDWSASAHANTYQGFNDNTYCAHCMSPFQAGPEEDWDEDVPVGAANWTNVGCTVCHDPHKASSEELVLYNGSAYEEVADSNELCGSCHTMGDAILGEEPHHTQIEMRTGTGGLGVPDMTWMPSVECAECHNSHSLEPGEYACVVCHEPISLPPTTNETAKTEIDDTQTEIGSMLTKAKANLTDAEEAKMGAEENGTWNSTLNDTYWRAVFNYYFVYEDFSQGVHNYNYAKALLELAEEDIDAVIKGVVLLPNITVSPANLATDVPVDTVITVTFEQGINFTDFQTNNYLTVSGGVAGELSYDNTIYTVTFAPSADLEYDTEYTATLNSAVQYADGSSVLGKDFEWSFTTGPVQDVTVIIGPILKDGEAVEGATVTLTIDGIDYIGTTNDQGYATITVPAAEYRAGNFSVKVTKSGLDAINFDGTFGDNGEFTPPSGGIPEMKSSEDGDGDDMTILLIAIIVIIIIVVIILALAMRRKPAEEELEEEEEEAAEEEEFECPECGAVVAGGAAECPECGAEFEEEEEPEEEEEFECLECGAKLEPGTTLCPECGTEFEEEEELEGEEEELEDFESEEEEEEELGEEEELEEEMEEEGEAEEEGADSEEEEEFSEEEAPEEEAELANAEEAPEEDAEFVEEEKEE